ncbi:hypothetical protein J7L48_04170 [bacterium]|nr:hypothetical protein [bacterium]
MGIDGSTLENLYQKKQGEIKYNLNNIKKLARAFSDPQKELKVIHITGTNGKGSVSAILESLLISSGYKVGLFTSPHLVNYNERFRIDQKDIDDEILKKYINMITKRSREIDIEPSFFEISTMVAFLYFSREKVDYAILEVGLGGRLDATNIVIPIISIITMIDIEHKRLLGNTKTKIAIEKCGIVKKGHLFITGEPSSRIRNTIIHEGLRRGGIYGIENKIIIKKNVETLKYQKLDISVKGKSYKNLTYPLLGDHQLRNLKLALNGYLNIFKDLSTETLRNGLKNIIWKGRMTLFSHNPLIYVDGCHNSSASISLKKTIKTIYSKNKIGKKYLLFGMVKKKALSRVSSDLFPLFDIVYITDFETERARELKDYLPYLKKNAKKFIIFNKLENAMEILHLKMRKEDFLLCTGSLYLVGDFLKRSDLWEK